MSLFRCPVCGEPLSREERTYRCPNRHSYDIAKEGYTYLLPPNQKHSAAPGDDKGMAAARRDFLSKGYYAPLLNALCAEIVARTGDAPEVICKLGDGADIDVGSNSNPRMARKMIEVARAKKIPHTVTACPAGSGTNAWPIQMQGIGVTTLVVSLPLKYMHSPVEMLRMCDVKNVGKLVAAFLETFDGRL